jgi:hypothetical protein
MRVIFVPGNPTTQYKPPSRRPSRFFLSLVSYFTLSFILPHHSLSFSPFYSFFSSLTSLSIYLARHREVPVGGAQAGADVEAGGTGRGHGSQRAVWRSGGRIDLVIL